MDVIELLETTPPDILPALTRAHVRPGSIVRRDGLALVDAGVSSEMTYDSPDVSQYLHRGFVFEEAGHVLEVNVLGPEEPEATPGGRTLAWRRCRAAMSAYFQAFMRGARRGSPVILPERAVLRVAGRSWSIAIPRGYGLTVGPRYHGGEYVRLAPITPFHGVDEGFLDINYCWSNCEYPGDEARTRNVRAFGHAVVLREYNLGAELLGSEREGATGWIGDLPAAVPTDGEEPSTYLSIWGTEAEQAVLLRSVERATSTALGE